MNWTFPLFKSLFSWWDSGDFQMKYRHLDIQTSSRTSPKPFFIFCHIYEYGQTPKTEPAIAKEILKILTLQVPNINGVWPCVA